VMSAFTFAILFFFPKAVFVVLWRLRWLLVCCEDCIEFKEKKEGLSILD